MNVWSQTLRRTHLRPQMSEPTPQKTAPIKRPIFCWSAIRGLEEEARW